MENDLRRWIRLVEGVSEPDDDDDEDEDRRFNAKYDDDDAKYDNLPSSSAIKSHLPYICAAAQKVYDDWDQSDPDNDELNGGGVCHLIADKIADILSSAGIRVTTQQSMNEQHVYCVCQFRDGVFEIDIPHQLYERGGGFTWYKLPNIVFTPADVQVECLDGDPARMGQYVEDWEEGPE
jgi:hypothetical protein